VNGAGILISFSLAVAVLFTLVAWYVQHSEEQFYRNVAAIVLRSRTPGGSEQTPGGRVPQPPPGSRAGVEARGVVAAAPPPAPSSQSAPSFSQAGSSQTLVGTAVPRPGVPTRLHQGTS